MGLMKAVDDYAWGQAISTMVDPTAEALAQLFGIGYAQTAGEGWRLPNERAAAWAQDRAATLVRGVDQTTKDRIATLVADAERDPDMTQAQLADAIRGLFDDMSDSRAKTIATTESAYANAAGDIAGYRDTGVGYVEISDGTESDQECADADGQVWTVDEYEANPLEHPNCGRSASAISDAEAEERGIDRG